MLKKNLSYNEPRMKHIQILYKRCVIFPLSGIRYPTGAGVGAGKLGKGSKNSPLKKKKKSSLVSNTENKP